MSASGEGGRGLQSSAQFRRPKSEVQTFLVYKNTTKPTCKFHRIVATSYNCCRGPFSKVLARGPLLSCMRTGPRCATISMEAARTADRGKQVRPNWAGNRNPASFAYLLHRRRCCFVYAHDKNMCVCLMRIKSKNKCLVSMRKEQNNCVCLCAEKKPR